MTRSPTHPTTPLRSIVEEKMKEIFDVGYHLKYISAIFMGVLIVLGCRGTIHQPVATPSSSIDDPMVYQTALERWTRESRIYDGLETKLISKATFKSAAFRQAYTAEYVRLYRLKAAEFEKMAADQAEAAAAYHDFIVAAYVPQKNWDDFSKDPSMWKLYMTTDGVSQIKPLEIRKLKKKDPILAYFFPYITTWNSVYQVRFPILDPQTGDRLIEDEQGAVTLVMNSVLGSAEFQWQLNMKP